MLNHDTAAASLSDSVDTMAALPQEISQEQRRVMEHALGLNYKKKPYRNRFYTRSDNKDWNDLVSIGMAEKGGGWKEGSCYFRVTFAGAKSIYTKPMSQKYFDDLS